MNNQEINKRHILITPEYPPMFGGGISNFTYSVVKQLVGNRGVIVVVPSLKGESNQYLGNLGEIVFEVGSNQNTPEHLSDWLKLSWQVSEVIQSLNITPSDTLEFIDYGGLAYFTIKKLLASEGRPILICSTVNPSFNTDKFDGRQTHSLNEYLTGYAEKFCLLAANFVIAPTKVAADQLRKEMPLDKVEIEFPPFPLVEHIHKPEPPMNRNYDYIFFGRQQTLKGFKEFCKASKLLLEEDPNLRIGVLGGEQIIYPEGITSKDYAHRVFGSLYSKIHFFGLVNFPLEVIKQAHVAVMPSLTDFSPNTVLESLHVRCSIVITEGTGSFEMANEFFEHRNAVFLARNGDFNSVYLQMQKALFLRNKSEISLKVAEMKQASIRLSEVGNEKLSLYPTLLELAIETESNFKDECCEIVIPHFNQSIFLGELIESLVSQGFPVARVHVVDDGSKPTELAKIKVLREKFNFNLISKNNGGLPSARNAGLENVESSYVLFLDSDDLIDIEYVERSIKLLKSYKNAAAVGCWIQCFGESNQILGTLDANSPLSIYKNTLNTSALVWKTAAIRSLDGYRDEMILGYEDFDLAVRAMLKGYVIPVIDEPLFKYRVRRNSMYQSMSRDLHLMQYEQVLKNAFLMDRKITPEVLKLILVNGDPTKLTSVFLSGWDFKERPLSENLRVVARRFPKLRKIWGITPWKFKRLVLRWF